MSPRLSSLFWLLLAAPLRLAAQSPVVINEIHYDENDPTVHAEFIELHNAGAAPVDVGGWYFSDGVPFVFPAGTTLAADGYVIVCENPSVAQAKWGVSGARVFDWNEGVTPRVVGRLKNGSDRVTLRNAAGEKISEVEYKAGFPWPTVGGTPSYSIELINPSLDHTLGGHWRRSDGQAVAAPPVTYVPAGSREWLYRKALGEPSSPTSAWRAPDFSTDDGTWLSSPEGAPFGYGDPADTTLSDMRGNYTGLYLRHTFTFTGSAPGPLTLRVWNDDGFIAWLNGVEIARFGPAEGVFVPYTGTSGRNHEGYGQAPDVVILGAPDSLLIQGANVLSIHALNDSLNNSSDFYIDAELKFEGGITGAGPTPLARNSVFASNAPPAIRQVNHAQSTETPATWLLPGAETRITAKITDPEGVAEAVLSYQIVEPGDYIALDDPRYEAAASWTEVPMRDDGAGGDLTGGDDVFTGLIPADVAVHRRLVRYRVTARDTTGLSVRAPYLDDPQPNFAAFVYGEVPDYTAKATPTAAAVTYPGSLLSSVATYHLLTTPRDHANAQQVPVPATGSGRQNPTTGQYGHSLYNWHGALCYDGRVYDHIRYRARGGVWRFSMGKNMWKFDFNKGHDFEAKDNYGQSYDQKWKKLNFSACIQQGDFQHRGEQGLFESVGFRLFQLTGLPAEHTHFVHFRIIERPEETNGTPDQFDDDFQGLYLAIEQQDGQFLDEHGLPKGNLYKMEGGSGELNNQGPQQPKNKSDLNAFLNYGTTEAWWREHCDLPNYYNYRAIVDAIHHYDIGDGKNYFFYHNPVTAKWTALPWDLDLTWADNMYRGDNGIAGLPPSGNSTEPFFSRVFGNGATTGVPALRIELRNRVREVLDLLFTPEQTGMIIDEMASHIYRPGQLGFVEADRAMWDYNPILVSSYVNSSKGGHGRFYESAVNDPATPANEARTFPGMIHKMKTYITRRRQVMTSQVLTTVEEALVPGTPVITREGEGPVSVNTLAFASSPFAGKNGATFSAMKWRLAEVTDPADPAYEPYARVPRRYEAEAVWESEDLTDFHAEFAFPAAAARPGGLYRARVKHRDSAGRWSHWSAPVQFIAAEPDLTPYLNALVVSQFMYNPAPPTPEEATVAPHAGEYEWIELLNVGDTPLDLTPVRFTKGVDFDFAGNAVTTLAPGARVLVVKNLAAFNARYGDQVPAALIAGAWEGGDSLNNAGEQLKLSYGAGLAIRDFVYQRGAPWPAGADGDGASLVLIDPSALPDHTDGANWRASTTRHGTPGATEEPPSLTGYAAWAVAYGNLPAEGDADGDGFSNFAEYALMTSPVAAEDAPAPEVSVVEHDGALHLAVAIRRREDAPDVAFMPEISSDLDDWQEAAEAMTLVSSQPLEGGARLDTYRGAQPVAGRDRLFFRLRLAAVP